MPSVDAETRLQSNASALVSRGHGHSVATFNSLLDLKLRVTPVKKRNNRPQMESFAPIPANQGLVAVSTSPSKVTIKQSI